MKHMMLVEMLPLVCLFFVGGLVGSQFEVLWMRFAVGMPAGTVAYFVFRQWGKWICRDGND
jgi:hypothetical protein